VHQQRLSAEHVLLLDTGDALVGGGVLGDLTQGEVIVAGMNAMGYDALTLGPRELTLGVDLLQQRIGEAQFPMLSANVVYSGTNELVASPYKILEVGELRLGVVGLTRQADDATLEFEVLDALDTLAEYVPLVAEQADVVIVLTNASYRTGLELAREVPGIDLMVAALPAQLPNQAIRASHEGAIVVSAEQPLPRHTGRRLGRLVLEIDSEGVLDEKSWASVPLDNTLVDDLEMTGLLDRYRP
jgi:2',3'-cyclic-nucleotide 2'-phosphodiesterase (5'-nucleotidase family)